MTVEEGYRKITVRMKETGVESQVHKFKMNPIVACCDDEDYSFFRKHTQGHIEGSLKLEVQGGCGPYTWESSEELLYFIDPGLGQTIIRETATGVVTVYEGKNEDPDYIYSGGQITVTDACDNVVTIDIVSCAQDKIWTEDMETGCRDNRWEDNVRLYKSDPFDNYIVAAKVVEVIDDFTIKIDNLQMAIGDSYWQFAQWLVNVGQISVDITSDIVVRAWIVTGQGDPLAEEPPELISLDITQYVAGDINHGLSVIQYDPDTITLSAEHGFELDGVPSNHCIQRAESPYAWVVVEFDVWNCDCQKKSIYYVNGGNFPFEFTEILITPDDTGTVSYIDPRFIGDTRIINAPNNEPPEGQAIWTGESYPETCRETGTFHAIDACGYESWDVYVESNPLEATGRDATLSIPTLSCGGITYDIEIANGVDAYCGPLYDIKHEGSGVFEKWYKDRRCVDGWKGEQEYEVVGGATITTPSGSCCTGSDTIRLEACDDLVDQVITSYGAISDIEWKDTNPDTMTANDTIAIEVEGGVGPFTWTLQADKGTATIGINNYYTGVTLGAAVTSGRTNTVTSVAGCGGFDVVVTDACGSTMGSVRVTGTGFWSAGAAGVYERATSDDYPTGTNPGGCTTQSTTRTQQEYHGRFNLIFSNSYFSGIWQYRLARCCQACCEPPIGNSGQCYDAGRMYASYEANPLEFPWTMHDAVANAVVANQIRFPVGGVDALNNGCALACPTYSTPCSTVYAGDPDLPCETCDGTEYLDTLLLNRENCEANWHSPALKGEAYFLYCN